MTRVLIVGAGGREHAIAWKLRQSPLLTDLWIAPGNGGTNGLAAPVDVSERDVDGLTRVAVDRRADLVIVGPEEPLALGLADRLRAAGILCFGPSAAAARIEASKTFAKEIMASARVPTAQWRSFDDLGEARAFIANHPLPVVVKADGLAAGKGVAVCATFGEASEFLERVMGDRSFGEAGSRVVIEECLIGTEASAFAICDGERIALTAPASDYKPVFDGDRGPNTGGMGSYSPTEVADERVMDAVGADIFAPVLRELAARGIEYRGVLYAGLMMTAHGPRVVEFNSRMGDPETQVVLPRLASDLLSIALAAASGGMHRIAPMVWRPDACVGVVLASRGYPGAFPTGLPISGLDDVDEDVMVFHAGTRQDQSGRVVTAGGRVVTVVAVVAAMARARERAYQNAARIRFDGAHYRRDIALRAELAEASITPK